MKGTTIEYHRIKSPQSPLYPFVESLIQSSFPPEEYRIAEERAHMLTHQPLFHLTVATTEHKPIAVIGYWTFRTFLYIEHLAITPEERNKNYGTLLIEKMKQMNHPLILEVEPPTTPLAARRIRFYQRASFTLWEIPYRQPPYRKEGKSLSMQLMCHGALTPEKDYHHIKQTLYTHVYQVEQDIL